MSWLLTASRVMGRVRRGEWLEALRPSLATATLPIHRFDDQTLHMADAAGHRVATTTDAREQVESPQPHSAVRSRTLLEAVRAACITDAYGRICALPEASSSAWLGVPLHALASPEARDELAERWHEECAKGRPFELETNLSGDALGRGRVSLRARPVLVHGAAVEWVVTFEPLAPARASDEGELTKRLQEAQRLDSLGVLAGGIAHDFNNLLLGMIGHAELIARGLPSGSPMHHNVHSILACADRAALLCKQMLAYAGRGHFVLEPCDLVALGKEMHALLTSLCSGGARLSLEAPEKVPQVRADPAQLQQVLLSLVANATEAFDGHVGSITVRIGCREFSAEELVRAQPRAACMPGEYVFLEVEDDGPGIASEHLPRVFEPFFSTKFTGRGLGLSAVLGIARSHGGLVDLHSERARGTRVRVLFPPALRPSSAGSVRPMAQAGSRVTGTVLVVDDDPMVRELSRATLEDTGTRVLVADGGEQALQLYRAHGPSIDLVLLDLTMPGMDGAATLRALRELSPSLRVVLMSGYSAVDATERAGTIDGFVQKPWRPSELLHVLAQAMHSRAPQVSLEA